MEAYEHSNGSGHTDPAIEADGSAIVAAIHTDENPPSVTGEIKQAVAAIGAQLSENLQALSVQLGTADRIYTYLSERTQAITSLQEQVTAVQQELQGVQNFVRGLPQEVQTLRQDCEGKLDSVGERFEQRLQSEAQAVAGLDQKLAVTNQTLDDKSGQISHLEISVAALLRDAGKMSAVEAAIADLNQKGGEHAATMADLAKGCQSLKRLTMLTSATALILAVVVGVQMLGGWPLVARYVELLRSAFS